MCRRPVSNKVDDLTSSKATNSSSPALEILLHVAIAIYVAGFISFRAGEIGHLFVGHPIESSATALVALFLVKRNLHLWYIVAIVSILATIYICDVHLLEPLPPIDKSLTVVITGANSGVGFETAKALASRSATVIMACRSMKKCNDAASRIAASDENAKKVIPMYLDLANFESVKNFAIQVEDKLDQVVDVLVNNAGYVPPTVEPINQYGLDPSITSMHISHHFLTELMVKQNPMLRVVTVASGTHHICAFNNFVPEVIRSTLGLWIPGCIDEEYLETGIHSPVNAWKYITSKVANIMHVLEIPRRHTSSTSIAIDLGWVGTNIQPWMTGSITPASLGWMRSAKIGIYPNLMAILQPTEFFEHNWTEKGGLLINPLGDTYESFTHWFWTGQTNKPRMEELSKKLWETTTSILTENGYIL